jgi:tRNA-dihydrouridine synthase B
MIGRGAYGKPWLLAQVMAALTGQDVPEDPTLEQQYRIITEHYQDMLKPLWHPDRSQSDA